MTDNREVCHNCEKWFSPLSSERWPESCYCSAVECEAIAVELRRKENIKHPIKILDKPTTI